MIRRLQTKFILITMSAMLAVLFVIIAGINLVNYGGVVDETDEILTILIENKGSFSPGSGRKGTGLRPGMSPETPFESRYFSVLLNRDSHTVVQVETGHIISIDTEKAIEYAQEIAEKQDDRGFKGNFRYAKSMEEDTIRIIFLDCKRNLDSFYKFLFASISISMTGYLIVLALVVFFSNRIIRPISESYEKQKRFITDAGHEIKTPLTIINADADILEMDFGENEWIDDIHKQAKRLTALTNDLVYLARMEEAADAMVMIDFPISDVVGETAASFQAPARTQGKSFQCSIQPMLSLKGNEKAIRQLTGILLDNALKYSPEGGIVRLTLERRSRGLQLTVSNTTEQEISKENLSMLFERFYRIDVSRNSGTGGYGIGLSVAKAIVTAHGGKIKAQMAPGNDGNLCAEHESSEEQMEDEKTKGLHTLEIRVTLPA
ncbi:MAG: sensor histidine kinase [Lachnospiraceae bacterium]